MSVIPIELPFGREIVQKQSLLAGYLSGNDGEVNKPFLVVKFPPHSPILYVMSGATSID